MIDALSKLTEGMRAKVQLMVGRAILSAVSDGGPIQTVQAQLLADEVLDDVEHVQHYGYTSVPLAGAEGVLVFVGGNRDHGLVIATDDRRHRPIGLEPGEVAIYDDQGQEVRITRGGIVVNGAGKPVTITNASVVRMESHLEVTGDIKDQCDGSGKTMASMRSIYNGHGHPAGGPPSGQM
jgi:phage baseplate assembly protein V